MGAALLAGCFPAGTPAPGGSVVAGEAREGEGRPPRPLRIVSINPCSDAVLAEVAEPGQLVAISRYSHDPRTSSMNVATARQFTATSGTVEEILPLRPDLVVSGTYMSPATLSALRRLGIRVELLPIAATVEESEAQVRRLAALAGHPDRGEALVAEIRQALAKAQPKSGGDGALAAPVSAVVWQSGGIVPGEQTLIADLMRRTGFTSLSAARGLGQADVLPLEHMVADPPELILSAGDAHGQEDRMLAHPALAHLAGVRHENLDPSLLYCGGPTIIRAARRLAEIRRGVDRDRQFAQFLSSADAPGARR